MANSRPRLSRRYSRIMVTVTPRIARRPTNQSVFERKPAPDLIRGGYRFARRKRVKINDQEGDKAMKSEITGITRANEGMQGISWNILGQTYVPKNCTEHCFSWHATLPPGTFVPPHIHPDQDEYLYMLEGKLDFMLAGADAQATPGDLIRLGMGVPHGIFNKSDQTAKVLFWVSPTQKLYDLFWGLHNMKEQKPEDVVAMAAEYNIHFLPPPEA